MRVIGGLGTAGGPAYWAGCDHCNWRAWGKTEAEAIAAWNLRSDQQKPAAPSVEVVEITEADEMAVAAFEWQVEGGFSEQDKQMLAHAFALHRLATLQSAPPAPVGDEPVAWMYELFEGKELSLSRMPLRISWKETPLYARPVAAQAVAIAARDFCAELCEDSPDVPQPQLKALHAALDTWEGRTQHPPATPTPTDAKLREVEEEITRMLCEDCPPSDYPTDDTRCEHCPRRPKGALALIPELRAAREREVFAAGFHAAERALGFEGCDESDEALEIEWEEYRAALHPTAREGDSA